MTTIDTKYVFGTFEELDVTERLENDDVYEKLLGHIEENGLMDEIIMHAVDDLRDWVEWTAGDAMWDALDVGVFKATGKHIIEWEEEEAAVEKDYMTEDIEMYWVEEIDGRKVIHYNGYLWYDDGTWHEEEGSGCGLGGRGSEVAYVDAIEGSIYDFVWKQFERVQQYGGPITDEEHEAYARGWCENATYLPMDEVTVDTPCGTYWY